jgi:aryl-alcohol dehydrogenase (NADP+)
LTRFGNTALEVFPLCLGGNVFGWTADRDQSFAVLDAYADAGGNFLDTADSYASWLPGSSGGESESIIGDWLASRGLRDHTVVATKVGQLAGYTRLDAKTIARAADNSLRRLRTDYIDLYFAHVDDESTSLDETLAAFDQLVTAGKVRYIGASNFSADRFHKALAISRTAGMSSFVALQNHYNLLFRDEYERGPADRIRREGLAFVPYYSLAEGYLTGKYRSGGAIESARADGAASYAGAEAETVLSALASIAAKLEVPIAAVALAWLRTRKQIPAPLASARSVDQLSDLLASTRFDLSVEDVWALDVASGGQHED